MGKKVDMPDELREWFRQQGAKGGAIGGKKRWASISAEERSRRMKEVAAARLVKDRK